MKAKTNAQKEIDDLPGDQKNSKTASWARLRLVFAKLQIKKLTGKGTDHATNGSNCVEKLRDLIARSSGTGDIEAEKKKLFLDLMAALKSLDIDGLEDGDAAYI